MAVPGTDDPAVPMSMTSPRVGMRPTRLRLLPHDPAWPWFFEEQAERIRRALDPVLPSDATEPPPDDRAGRAASSADPSSAARVPGRLPRIEHVGSTSVPGLLAKPIVDLLLVAPGLDDLDRCVAPLEALGWVHRGPYGDDPLRRYFVLDRCGRRMAQLHAWPEEAPAWRDMLRFRDLLRGSADLRAAYEREKLRVAEEVGWDKRAYSVAKGAFIEDALRGGGDAVEAAGTVVMDGDRAAGPGDAGARGPRR